MLPSLAAPAQAEPYLPLARPARSELAAPPCPLAALPAAGYLPEHNPNPVLCVSEQGQLTFANASARRLRQHLPPVEAAAWPRQLLAAAPPTAPQAEVVLGARSFQVTAVYEAPGTDGVLLYLTETTARLAAERQLAEQRAFIDQLLAATPSLVYVRDAAGKLVFQNRAMLELRRQLTDQGHVPTTDHLAANPDEQAHIAQVNAQVLATNQPVASEDHLTLPNGERRWYQSIRHLLVRPDGARQVLGVSTDITAQKQAHRALDQREKLYHDLVLYSQALICTHDLRGQLISSNPATATLLGRPLATLSGLPLREMALPRYQAEVTGYLRRLSETGSQRGVLTLVAHDGQLRHVLFDSHLVREEGQKPYAISYGQDITKRLQAEQHLLQAKLAAEAAMLARESFLANMSHEIRTPLNGVLGMASQLAKTTLDRRQQEFVQTIRHSGQHLLRVINDVLDIAKITSGKLEMEARPFNLCDSVREAVRPLALQALEKRLQLVGTPLSDTCPNPWVLGDSHRINQILINLVGNALKFTEPGGQVVVGCEQQAETDTTLTIHFSVQDTGIGIAPDKQALIFEGFTQADPDTTRRFGGTGLGLNISRALVAQLGGELTLQSELGVGSTFAFSLTLPKAPAPPLPPPAPDAYDTGALRGRRVLVVEDNEINRTVARMLLEGWGAHVDEAEDGMLGVAQVQHELPYDLVLMDIQLPGLSGIDATRAIRMLPDPARANSRIVALTANAFLSDRARYLAAGMDACLAKPFEEEEVYRTLLKLLPTPQPYDLSKLRSLARGREEFVQKIIRSFLQNMPHSLAQLRTAAATGRWADAATTVHHFKPSLESLGVLDVAPLVAQLESTSPADFFLLPAAAAQLAAQVQRVLDTLPAELVRDAARGQ